MITDLKQVKAKLPKGWTGILSKKTGVSKRTIWDIVTYSKVESPYWHEVISLAQKEQNRIEDNKKMTSRLISKTSKTIA